MHALVAPSIAGFALLLAACSPPLDWREVRVDDGGLTALFPCRPHRAARALTLAGHPVRMQMTSCSDDGITYATSYADLDDPSAIQAALEALKQSAVANVGGAVAAAVPFAVRGATPNAATGRIAITGRLPDGRAIQEHAAFFPRGLRVYQASLIGGAPPAAAVDGFFAGLAFRS